MMAVAAVSFLIGSILSVIAIDKGDGGNPFDQIWEAINTLEGQLDSIECGNKTGFFTTPAYDSGWISAEGGGEIVLTHNLGTTEVFVYLVGKDKDGTLGIHQFEYGGMYWAYWHNLDSNNISVTVYPTWDYVRVMIWKIQD